MDRVSEAEGRISELEDTVKDLSRKVCQLVASTKKLETRTEDTENRARRNNPSFVGFTEGLEGDSMEHFLEQWLLSWIPKDSLSSFFVIERAHRSLQR